MAKFAITLSNGKIVYPTAPNEIAARNAVTAKIAAQNLSLSITSVRKVSGR
jgi:hypothetical protein